MYGTDPSEWWQGIGGYNNPIVLEEIVIRRNGAYGGYSLVDGIWLNYSNSWWDQFNSGGGGPFNFVGGASEGNWGNYSGYGHPSNPIVLPDVTITGTSALNIASQISSVFEHGIFGTQVMIEVAQRLGNVPADEIIDGVNGSKFLLWAGRAIGFVDVLSEIDEFQQTGDYWDLWQAAYSAVGIGVKLSPGGAIGMYLFDQIVMEAIDAERNN